MYKDWRNDLNHAKDLQEPTIVGIDRDPQRFSHSVLPFWNRLHLVSDNEVHVEVC